MAPLSDPAPKSLKQVALKNPTLLGDPTSTKSETTETPNPDDESNVRPSSSSQSTSEKGSTQVRAATDMAKPQDTYASASAPVMAPAPTERDTEEGPNTNAGQRGETTLKEKAEKSLRENPTMLGDPVSLKAETSDNVPTPDEAGAGMGGGEEKENAKLGEKGRESKL